MRMPRWIAVSAFAMSTLSNSSSADAAVLTIYNLPDFTSELAWATARRAIGQLLELEWESALDSARAAHILFVIDPVAATVYDGKVVIRYDPLLLSVESLGWFGEFGIDSSLPAPPASPDGFLPDGGPGYLQPPNPLLTQTVNVDQAAGLITAAFDWGPDGFPITSPGHFNFFGVVFSLRPVGADPTALYSISLVPHGTGNLGLVDGAQQFRCSQANSSVIGQCGTMRAGDYQISQIPEPSSLVLMLSGFTAYRMANRRRRHGQL